MPRIRFHLALLAVTAFGLTACGRVYTVQQQIHNILHPPLTVAGFAEINHYAKENRTAPPGQVIFFGDSIFHYWSFTAGSFFPGKPYLNRAIGGQTTPQLLLRFRQDVLDLHPSAVVLLAGTNDILGKAGPETDAFLQGNIRSMVELAQTNNIRVILVSVLPVGVASDTGTSPIGNHIVLYNQWLSQYHPSQPLVFLDIYSRMADPRGHFRAGLTIDGLHPSAAGYAVMAPLIESAIDTALTQQQ